MRLIQDTRRDTSAIVLLVGFITFGVTPLLIDWFCQSSVALPMLALGPALLAASLVLRSRRGWAIVGAAALFAPLFLLEVGIALFVSSPEHCPFTPG